MRIGFKQRAASKVIRHPTTVSVIFLIMLGLTISFAGVSIWQHKNATQLNKQVLALDVRIGELTKQVANLQSALANNSMSTSSDYAVGTRLSGKITADACISPKAPIGDIGCSLTVDSLLTIQVVHGNLRQTHPWGNLLGFPNWPINPTGKTVEVYAHQLDKSNYTLEGSSDYYVRIVN